MVVHAAAYRDTARAGGYVLPSECATVAPEHARNSTWQARSGDRIGGTYDYTSGGF